jgi:hypothetical protein
MDCAEADVALTHSAKMIASDPTLVFIVVT